MNWLMTVINNDKNINMFIISTNIFGEVMLAKRPFFDSMKTKIVN